jgi:energy-coupling factor transporter transmembrane protein EcfT
MGRANQTIWWWDVYRRESQFYSIGALPIFAIMAASRYALLVIPSIALVVVYWVTNPPATTVALWEQLLHLSAIVGIAAMLITLAYTVSLYVRQPAQENK